MRWLARLFMGLTVLGAAAAVFVYAEYQRFSTTPLALPEAGFTLQVERGQTLRDVAQTLAVANALGDPRYLVWFGRWRDQSQRIRAGEYRIAADSTPGALLDQLVAGAVVQHSITFIEGWTFRQLRAALNAHEVLNHATTELDDAAIMARLGRAGVHPEGRFLPDTYQFPRGESDLAVLERAATAMDQALAGTWATRETGLPLETADQALVLASIVEKETGVAAERAEIAGVFIRRLRRGMRLQTDPTVIYGLGETFDGNLRRRDLEADTPYNTYTRAGLPPTPIAMPGRAALHAAVHPAAGTALYFVADGSGGHVFSDTLEDHNRAVARHQLGRP
ncbi:MAG: endolytic transglycosylase MltG [Chromatiales bacterium]|nr:endolytic transglycosylase MltG [Chromatiales bacterium]